MSLQKKIWQGFILFIFLPLVLCATGPSAPTVNVDVYGSIFAMWEEDFADGTSVVKCSRFDVGAISWTHPIVLSTPGRTAFSIATHMNFNGDLIAGWYEIDPVNQVVSMVVSTRPTGGEWRPPTTVSLPTHLVYGPFIVHITQHGICTVNWTSFLLDEQQPVFHSSNGGLNTGWSAPIRVSG
jgi:hypothetical protein